MTNKIEVRIASNEDGNRIHDLLAGAGFTIEGLNWNNIAPFWLIAVLDGEIVGCVQVLLSLPMGAIEMLAVDDKVSPVMRGRIVKILGASAMATLKQAGAQATTSVITFKRKDYKRILKKRGAVTIASGNVIAMRLE